MKFNFKIQQYQTDAVEAVANVFAGQGFHDKIAYRRDVGDNQPKTYQMTFGADEELDPMNETGYVNCFHRVMRKMIWSLCGRMAL